MRPMDSKRRRLPVSFAFFQSNYLPNGQVNETVAVFEELTDHCKPGAMDGVQPVVMKYSCKL